jgi:hypothetical protein
MTQLGGSVQLNDGPSLIWTSPNIVSLSCRDFVRFKPGSSADDPNNIWVTLGIVRWETVGMAEQDFWNGIWAITLDGTPPPVGPDSSDEFPRWLVNQAGMH